MTCRCIIILLLFLVSISTSGIGQTVMSDTIVHIERQKGKDDLQTIIESDDINSLPIGTEVHFFNGVPVLEYQNTTTSPPHKADTNTTQNTELSSSNHSSLDSNITTSPPQKSSSETNDKTTTSDTGTLKNSKTKKSLSKNASTSKRTKSNTSRSSSSRSQSNKSSKIRKKHKRKKAPKWNPFNKRKNREKSGCKY